MALAIVEAVAKFKEWLHPQNDHVNVTQTTPLSGGFFTLRVRVTVVDLLAKFKKCSFIRSRNIEGDLKFFKRVT